jgi:hypothetical protein
MIKSTMKAALPVAIALALSACSSSDSSTTTPNTSGLASSGVITGFGSIFVNGVEFETGSATFNVDGVSGTQTDLAIGMKVDVEGTINADGVTGMATHVDFDEELQGPVSGINVGDGQTRSFTVLGTTVIIDINDTRFDDDNGDFSFDTIEDKDNVEISGFFDEMGALHATRIELEDDVFNASSIVEVEGTISGLSGTSFMIGLLKVDASAAAQEDLPNGLVDGIKVEVEGTYDGSILKADKVEGENDDLEDSDNEVEIEGIITRYNGDNDFEVDGHPVDASNAEREPSSLDLAEGVHIEVEGVVSNNILIASEVKTREDESEVAALVSGVNIDAGTFTLEPVSGESITVRITTTTELEDEFSEVDSFSITDIQENDFIKVEGHINDTGELEAKSVHRKDAADEAVVVEGIITTFDTESVTTTVTVMGVNFPYLEGFTKFEINEDEVSSTDFFAVPGVVDGTATIAVEDNSNPADGIADRIKLKD